MPDWLSKGAFSVRAKKPPDRQKELLKLQANARKLFEASGLRDIHPLTAAAELTLSFAEEHGVTLPLPALVRFAECTYDLLYEASVYLEDRYLQQLDVETEQGRVASKYLAAHVAFHEDERAKSKLFEAVLSSAYSHLFGRVALSPFARQAIEAGPSDESSLSLSLLNFIGSTDAAIEGIIRSLFVTELSHDPMFSVLKDQIEANTALASGLSPRISHPISNLTLPTESQWTDAEELVSRYLDGTPFDSLLRSHFPVSFPDSVRFEHTHIVAGSGHGKTQTLAHLILQDIEKAANKKRSVIVMDSQGDLFEDILKLAVLHRPELRDKIVWIDPSEFERPIALNPFSLEEVRLSGYSASDRERVVHSAVSLFEYFFGELLGAELTAQQGTVFKFLIRLLVEIPNATLQTLRELMQSPEKFRPHIEKLSGATREFFEAEFLTGGYSATRKQIQRRLWAVLSNPVFERLFSSAQNKLDWFSILQDGHIVLINTAKDFLKSDGSRLYGRFLSAQIGQGILERAAIPEHERTPTMFYIDEAQDQIDETIELLLSQGRKYKLGLTLAHQHLDQLTPTQRSGVVSNTSTKLVGGLNRKDAGFFAGEMNTSADFLQSMRKRGSRTHFGLHVLHNLDKAVPLTVPFGVLDEQDQVPDEIVQSLLRLSKKRFGRHWDQETIEAESQPSEESKQVTEKLPGRGSSEHKAEQERIRSIGAKLGYAAEVEKALENGLGAVDVSLVSGNARIAVEVSITTPPEHEVSNILKCLSAGFDYVIATAPTRDRLRAIERSAWREITAADSPNVLFLLPEDIEEFLRSHRDELDENKIMGYTVIVKNVPKSSEEKQRRRDRLNWLLNRAQTREC